jgi:hypothetical protein
MIIVIVSVQILNPRFIILKDLFFIAWTNLYSFPNLESGDLTLSLRQYVYINNKRSS